VIRAGIDLGGTKTEIAVLDPAGRVALRRRVPTPAGYDAIVACIRDLVTAAEAGTAPLARIGIGVPGSIGPVSGVMRGANSTVLNGRRFDRDLAAALARPVRLANDANCFALAEAVAGAARGARVVFGVILGTGVGGGIVIAGRPLIGCNAIAGEWGHMPLPVAGADEMPGPQCWCGRRGCVEAWLSGPALARDHARATGQESPAEAIAAAAMAGDGAAAATLARHLDRLARALAPVINILDPDAIVLGGGLSNLPGLAESLAQALGPHVFSDTLTTAVRRHALGDSAGAIGAAWLWSGAGGDASFAPQEDRA